LVCRCYSLFNLSGKDEVFKLFQTYLTFVNSLANDSSFTPQLCQSRKLFKSRYSTRSDQFDIRTVFEYASVEIEGGTVQHTIFTDIGTYHIANSFFFIVFYKRN